MNKKMWQTFLIILIFMLASATVAWLASYLFFGLAWPLPFATGAAFMIASVVFSFLRKKLPGLSWLALLLNALACGFFVASYIVGKKIFKDPCSIIHIPENPPVFFGSAKAFLVLAAAAMIAGFFYFILMLLLSVPRLKESKAYIIFSYLVYLAAIFSAVFLWKSFLPLLGLEQDKNALLLYLLFAVSAAALALGSLFRAENFKELLFNLIAPSTFSVGIIAVIVLLALACGDGDCDCGDCGDGCCCDCSPGYGQKKPKQTTMSSMSEPRDFSDMPKK